MKVYVVISYSDWDGRRLVEGVHLSKENAEKRSAYGAGMEVEEFELEE